MRFVYLGSRFTLHASSPRSVALTQLRFTCLAVASSAEDLHLQDRAHAGRTMQKAASGAAFVRDATRASEAVTDAECNAGRVDPGALGDSTEEAGLARRGLRQVLVVEVREHRVQIGPLG
jgi:hypothetical protein